MAVNSRAGLWLGLCLLVFAAGCDDAPPEDGDRDVLDAAVEVTEDTSPDEVDATTLDASPDTPEVSADADAEEVSGDAGDGDVSDVGDGDSSDVVEEGACSQDVDCVVALAYCDADGACAPRVREGEPCSRDEACASLRCLDSGVCGCRGDEDCVSSAYCGSGGGCLAKLDEIEACDRDGACVSGRCVEGLCQQCASGEGCPEGRFCSADLRCEPLLGVGAACASGEVCLTGLCEAQRCACQGDADCAPGSVCEGGGCVRSCADDGGCSLGSYCEEGGLCAPRAELGEACARDGACASGRCGSGTCVECTTESHCEIGAYCDATGRCAPKGTFGEACTENIGCVSGFCAGGGFCNCGSNAECPEGEVCYGTSCGAPLGAGGCDSHEACDTGLCLSGFCVTCSPGGCPDGTACVNSTCGAPLGGGVACEVDSQCASGVCLEEGVCACGPEITCGAGRACVRERCRTACEEGCLATEVCVDGGCIPGQRQGESCAETPCREAYHCNDDAVCVDCGSDADCAEPTPYCALIGRCVEPPEPGSLCGLDAHCPEGTLCEGGVCQCTDESCPEGSYCGILGCSEKGEGGRYCSGDNQCQSGSCVDQACEACVQDSDCLEGAFCEGGACVPRRAVGGACERGAACLSGSCAGGQCGCVEDTDCPEGSACQEGGACLGCASSEDCASDAYCRSTNEGFLQLCYDGKAERGELCRSDEQCVFSIFDCVRSGTEELGRCYTCDPAEEPDCSPGSFIRKYCNQDTDCDWRVPYCESRMATDSVWSDDAVLGPAVCRTCEGDTCERCSNDEVGLCQACLEDAHCGADEYCAVFDRCYRYIRDEACLDEFYLDSYVTAFSLVDESPPVSSRCMRCVTRNTCLAKGLYGADCQAGRQCASGLCYLGQCGCVDDGDCPVGDVCNPLGLCGACAEDADCSADTYCSPFASCEPRLAGGTPCERGGECLSGDCDTPPSGFYPVCVCSGETSCPEGTFCSGARCVACLEDGDCTGDGELGCRDGACVTCLTDGDCAEGFFCDSELGTCASRLDSGELCERDGQCAQGMCALHPYSNFVRICQCGVDSDCVGGRCVDGLCAECGAQGDCESSEYCSVDASCEPQVALGGLCVADVMCTSGHCQIAFGSGQCVSCLEDADCGASEFCTASNTCAPTLSVSEPCSEGSNCASGLCALNPYYGTGSVCVCGQDADCPSGDRCQLGACLGCLSDSDCGASEYCASNACAPRAPNGSRCTTDSGCSSGTCGVAPWTGGVSRCLCDADADCAGETCDTLTGLCVECTGDGDCASTEYCSSNACFAKLALGDTCAEASQCSSGACRTTTWSPTSPRCVCDGDGDCASSEVCDTLSGLCQDCLSDGDCASTEYCTSNTCTAKFPLGSACGGDNTCLSGACETISWSPSVPRCICDADADCDPSQVCDTGDGLCKECLADSDCASTEYCGGSTCRAKRALGESCTSTSQCVSERCGTPPGSSSPSCLCSNDADCGASGVCDITLGSCHECFDDGDCASSEYCSSKSCTPKLGSGSVCTEDGQCQSGVCQVFSPPAGLCL